MPASTTPTTTPVKPEPSAFDGLVNIGNAMAKTAQTLAAKKAAADAQAREEEEKRLKAEKEAAEKAAKPKTFLEQIVDFFKSIFAALTGQPVLTPEQIAQQNAATQAQQNSLDGVAKGLAREPGGQAMKPLIEQAQSTVDKLNEQKAQLAQREKDLRAQANKGGAAQLAARREYGKLASQQLQVKQALENAKKTLAIETKAAAKLDSMNPDERDALLNSKVGNKTVAQGLESKDPKERNATLKAVIETLGGESGRAGVAQGATRRPVRAVAGEPGAMERWKQRQAPVADVQPEQKPVAVETPVAAMDQSKKEQLTTATIRVLRERDALRSVNRTDKEREAIARRYADGLEKRGANPDEAIKGLNGLVNNVRTSENKKEAMTNTVVAENRKPSSKQNKDTIDTGNRAIIAENKNMQKAIAALAGFGDQIERFATANISTVAAHSAAPKAVGGTISTGAREQG